MTAKNEQPQQPNKTPSNQTRRSALKKILVGSGVAASVAVLPDKWAKPLVDRVLVPAHAQTSNMTYFAIISEPEPKRAKGGFAPLHEPWGPSAILVTVTGDMANVQANSHEPDRRLQINLNIDGTLSNDFTVIGDTCGSRPTPTARWRVKDYTFGAPNISIENVDSNGWIVTAPMGSGTLPDLLPCIPRTE